MRVTIGVRLGTGFLVMLLLVASAGVASIIAFGRLADLVTTLAQESDEVRSITDIRVGVAEADAALERAMATGLEDDVAIARSRQAELQGMVAVYVQVKRTGGSEDELLERLELAQQYFAQTFDSYLDAAALTADLGPQAFSQRQELAVDPYLSILNEVEGEATERMGAALDATQGAQSSLLLMMVAFTLIAALIGVGMAVGITRSVTVPVRQLVQAADQISTGDLDAAMEVGSRDEIGELADSMERMRVSLKAAMDRLRQQR